MTQSLRRHVCIIIALFFVSHLVHLGLARVAEVSFYAAVAEQRVTRAAPCEGYIFRQASHATAGQPSVLQKSSAPHSSEQPTHTCSPISTPPGASSARSAATTSAASVRTSSNSDVQSKPLTSSRRMRPLRDASARVTPSAERPYGSPSVFATNSTSESSAWG